MLSPYGQPQLTDFGIARLLDATTTVTRTIHATVAYAAPEVLLGRPATAAADVYGLGATLHACLAGSPPFPSTEHDNVVSLVSRITTQPPPDLRPLGVPDALASVIEHALAKDPGQRIPDASELRRRLEAAGAVLNRPADHTPPHPAPGPLLAPRDQELTGVVPPPVEPSPVPPPPAPLPTAPAPVRSRQPLPPPPVPYRRVHRPVRGSTVAAALLALLAVAGVLFLVTRDDGGDDGETASDDAPVTDPSSTSSSTSSSTTEPATEPEEPEDAGGSSDQAAAAEQYFEAISAGDLERSYSMLTPGFQSVQSRTSYESFWRSVGEVEVVGAVDVDPDGGTAVVPVTLGGRSQPFALRLVPDGNGGWLVDGPRPGEG
jgi:serine/threonine protein kinase